MSPLKLADTICAVATPPGQGGISVIRVSGSKAFEYTRKLASFLPTSPESHRCYFGTLKSADNQKLDEVVVTCFASGRSFTNEETTEISGHGSPLIMGQILQELLKLGARMADPGEFTYRAFANGRIDLVQAESVQTMISSRTLAETRNSLRQLEGGLSKKIASLQKKSLKWLAHIEAGIDFSEEGLEVLSPQAMSAEIETALQEIKQLLESFQRGRLFREGFRLVFLGRPNVGKSSLMNALLQEDRSIVTPIAGTTRDLVEGWLDVQGVRVSLIDSAGLRETQDEVEKVGVTRSRQSIEKADLVYYVVDCDEGLIHQDHLELQSLLERKISVTVVFNKVDLVQAPPNLPNPFEKFPSLVVSALNTEGAYTALFQHLGRSISSLGPQEDVVISQSRHFESLNRAFKSLQESQRLLESGQGFEFVALGLKEALLELQKILGQRLDEEIIDQIFKEFCLGK